MQRAVMVLVGALVLICAGNSFGADPNVTVEWRGGNSQGNWQMQPINPKSKDRVVFAGPTKNYSNPCFGGIEIPSTPTIFIDNLQKKIRLVFAPPLLNVFCHALYNPCYGYITAEVGPLGEGQWQFETVNTMACNYFTSFTVNKQFYSGGDGSESDPWQISNKDDLLSMRDNTGHYGDNFIMTADINMADNVYSTALIAADTVPGFSYQGTAFSGVFDGNGFKIRELSIDSAGYYLGLFGKIAGGEVRNLGIEDGFVCGSERVGGLAGWNVNGEISNCYSNCEIMGSSYIGGLVGWNSSSYIYNSYSSGRVYGEKVNVGGLVGDNYSGAEIWNCYSNSEVIGGGGVGGLLGENYDCNVAYCYFSGTVNGLATVGGLIGYNRHVSDISNCYSAGVVNGGEYAGGLLGVNEYGIVTKSYSASDVNSLGEFAGGFAGDNFGIIEKCFWDIQRQSYGMTESLGYSDGVVNVAGLSTEQMRKKDTFSMPPADWDFVKIWGIGEGQTYPYLRQYMGCDINQDRKVDYRDLALLAENWLAGI